MGARRKGRELAVQALYQLDIRGDTGEETLRLFWERSDASEAAKEFGGVLVAGVRTDRVRIDGIIAEATEHWRVERLSAVDLNVLRVATYELLESPHVPINIVLDEAIEIARRFGTAESSVFVNGVLDQIAGRLGRKQPSAAPEVDDDG